MGRLVSRNTFIFHTQTINQRKINTFHGLNITFGELCAYNDVFKENTLHFFKSLFFTKDQLILPPTMENLTLLGANYQSSLMQGVTKAKVHQVLMGIK